MTASTERGVRSAQIGMLINASLAVVKLIAGVVGNAYALVADAVESSADIFSSLVVWRGLRIASREANDDYPFGYPPETLFVVYCDGPHCNGADRAALQLAELGRKVKKMIGGVTGWLDEGFSLDVGA